MVFRQKFFHNEVIQLGNEIQGELASGRAPCVMTLSGPLGAGKTTFVQEFLESFAVDPSQVHSPTFLKMLEYTIPKWGLCLHLDAYRVERADDFDRMALDTYSETALWLIEWPEKFLEYFATRNELRAHLGFRHVWDLNFASDHALTWAKKSF